MVLGHVIGTRAWALKGNGHPLKGGIWVVTFLLAASGGLVGTANADGFSHLEQDEVQRYRPVHTGSNGATLIADLDAVTAPVVSPDGQKIAFSAAVGEASLGLFAVFTANVNGSGLEQVTPGEFAELDPVWTPDGARIVFSQNRSGSYIRSNCCRLASVDLTNGTITGITASVGAVRPSVSPDGTLVVFDNPSGIWTVPIAGGAPTLRVPTGFDATFSPDGNTLGFVRVSGGSHYLQTIGLGGSVITTRYLTNRTIESPVWKGGRIHFFEYSGAGYDGRSAVQLRSVNLLGASVRVERSFSNKQVGFGIFNNDEIMFYRSDGLFRFYNVRTDASLPSPILAGSHYTTGWDAITGVDLDGDGQDEMFFYRSDGLYRFYHGKPDGNIPKPLRQGSDYTAGWDAITAVDLDGDGQDEMFFYRNDGLYRYYQIKSDGSLPRPLRAGADYSHNWSEITAIDVDGDGQDEMLFYRSDGLYRLYNVRPDGRLGPWISGGSDWGVGWDVITTIDLEGDGIDELFFYRSDGNYKYQRLSADGKLGQVISQGVGYTTGWDQITPLNLDSTP